MIRRTSVALACVMSVLLWTAVVYAVGTVARTDHQVTGDVERYTFTWVSDASGDVSGNAITVSTTPAMGTNSRTVGNGRLIQVAIDPDGGGTQPTDLYDFSLKDANGIDVLGGAGSDASNALGEYFLGDPAVTLSIGSTLDIVIANAGNAKGGTVILWVAR